MEEEKSNQESHLKGWKTWTGGALMLFATGITYGFPQYAAFGEVILKLGEVLGLIGIAHKVQKAGRA